MIELWYNRRMAKKIDNKGRQKRPTKAELAKQQAMKEWLVRLITLIILVIAGLQLGVFGVTV